MRLLTPFTFALLASACGGTAYQYSGRDVYDYFPLDGSRSWEYMNDTVVDWQMRVEKLPNTADKGGVEVVTLEYSVKDPTELLFSIDWSSDSEKGVLIHGYHIEGGEEVRYDPPVVFGEYQMNTEDDVQTDTDGRTFTSALVAVEDCPNYWTTDKWECLHMSIDDGGSDSGAPFLGDWWIATKWGTSRFQPSEYDSPWILSKGEWSP